MAVEPVYDSVYLLTCRHAGYHNETLPVYVVRTTMEDGERRSGLVAADGSWCTGLTYQAADGISTEQILLVDENYLAWICDLDGRVTPSPMQEPLNKLWGDWWMELTSINSTVACMDAPGGGSWFVNFLTGQTRFLPGVSGCWQWTADGGLAVAYEDEKSGYLDCSGDWAIAPQFAYAGEFFGGYAVVNRTSSSPDEVINAQGETVLVSRGG